jgi:hypothetical protein
MASSCGNFWPRDLPPSSSNFVHCFLTLILAPHVWPTGGAALRGIRPRESLTQR